MSGLDYGRCPHDDVQIELVQIGENPGTGEPIEIDIHGVNAAVSVQAALVALTASMKVGHEPDFLEKVALALYDAVQPDPHSLCPLATLTNMLLQMVCGTAHVSFGDEGRVIIGPPNEDPGLSCVHGEDKECSDERDERPVDREGTGTSGEGLRPNDADQGGTGTDEGGSGGTDPEGRSGEEPDDDGGGIAP